MSERCGSIIERSGVCLSVLSVDMKFTVTISQMMNRYVPSLPWLVGVGVYTDVEVV